MRFMHSGNIFKLLSNLFPIEILHSRQELTQACEPESEQSNLPTMRKSRSSWKCNRWGTSGEAQIQLDTISRSLSLSFHHTVISSPFFSNSRTFSNPFWRGHLRDRGEAMASAAAAAAVAGLRDKKKYDWPHEQEAGEDEDQRSGSTSSFFIHP